MPSWKVSLWIILSCHIILNPAKQTCPAVRKLGTGAHSGARVLLCLPLPLPHLPAQLMPSQISCPWGPQTELQPGLWPSVCVNRAAFLQVCTRIPELQQCREGLVQLSLLMLFYPLSRFLTKSSGLNFPAVSGGFDITYRHKIFTVKEHL